ncbi:MAG: DNA polymerase III subunit gamma/tau C-terminal domain-containing protein, partial [Pseudomonadota bacterium]
LLDQAIAFGGGEVRDAATRDILGTVDRRELDELFTALAGRDAAGLIDAIGRVDVMGPDYGRLLSDLASIVQKAAVLQASGASAGMASDAKLVASVAEWFSAEDLQLAYQMLINGRRDLNYAPQPRAGFEMTLLRVLAFQPSDAAASPAPGGASRAPSAAKPSKRSASAQTPEPVEAVAEVKAQPAERDASADVAAIPDSIDWYRLVPELELSGVDRMLASNCAWERCEGQRVILSLDERSTSQYTEARRKSIERALATHFDGAVSLTIERSAGAETPSQRDARLVGEELVAAEHAIQADPNVQALVNLFDAELVPDSVVVRRHDESSSSLKGAKS